MTKRTTLGAATTALSLFAALSAASPAQSDPQNGPPDGPPTAVEGYLVLAGFGPGNAYDPAAAALAEGRGAEIVRFDPDDLEPLREVLVKASPRYVAIVLNPYRLHFDLQRRFLQLATEIDDDPFVDFEFGYITGRTPADAELLVARSLAREPVKPKRAASMDGGGAASRQMELPLSLRGESLPRTRFAVAGDEAFPEDGRDVAFIAEHLPELDGADVVMFAGHGIPTEVIGGPRSRDLRRASLADAVVLNVACYTGVTGYYYERSNRGLIRKQISIDDSFCLSVLETGVLGYTAYLCPRPAGPELSTDMVDLLVGGASLGAARRRDYDETVLGFLGFGADRMQLRSVVDGFPARDPVRDMMLEGATGGVLFGDPAVVPFVAAPERLPVSIAFAADGERTERVTVHIPAALRGLHASDQTARMRQGMAMKAHARVPLGKRFVAAVDDVVVRAGGVELDHGLVWAFEQDRGEHFAQVKVLWPRAGLPQGDVEVRFAVRTTLNEAQAQRSGGVVPEAVAAAPAQGMTEPLPKALRRAAAKRGVSDAIVECVWDLNQIGLGRAPAELRATQEALETTLRESGEEGFQAICALMDLGQAHYRTHALFAHVNQPGLDSALRELAERTDLPNYADWTALRALGHFDTPEVRKWLLDRLESESGAGRYMSVAQALAMLRERRAAKLIGERVLEDLDGWSGVAPQLVDALAGIGGPEAVEQLEAVAGSDLETLAARAKSILSRLRR